MRVISRARLKQFWELPGRDDAEEPLRAWFTRVNSKAVNWTSWAEVKSDFVHASLVGSCVVFNVGGNKYRLIVRILYAVHQVLILKVMTHEEYDKDEWKRQCRCYNPPSQDAGKRPKTPQNFPTRKAKTP